jgi:hypothetical protein
VTAVASQIDHLVVVADTLEHGAQWCESVLGVVPGPGGRHPLMGTHNRLLKIASETYPRAYFEIIAIDPEADPPKHTRWFDMDDSTLQQSVKSEPRLAHFVASTQDASAALKALTRLGIDRGELLAAERPTLEGLLKWQISVRGDGQRLFYGALPTLIQWDGIHPCESLPDSQLQLMSLSACHPRPEALRAAHAAVGLQGVAVNEGPPNLVAVLMTPKGPVTLESGGA